MRCGLGVTLESGGLHSLAQHFIVVHSDYGRFIRNANAASLAGVQYLLTADVAARHDAKRFTQRPQPAADDFLFFFPGGQRRDRPGGFINLARKASSAHPLRESIAPFFDHSCPVNPQNANC